MVQKFTASKLRHRSFQLLGQLLFIVAKCCRLSSSRPGQDLGKLTFQHCGTDRAEVVATESASDKNRGNRRQNIAGGFSKRKGDLRLLRPLNQIGRASSYGL